MKLECVELRHTGPFTGPVRVGPLEGDLNVLAAGNEAGKSTLLMAAARALFDRHTVTGEAIERLQPAGTNLAPDITVVFQTTAGRFRVRKCFLHSPTSELSEDRDGTWHLIADGDASDSKVLDLVGGIRPGRGVSKAEHWGLTRYLWARQGEGVDWPVWDDEAGARVRTGLAQVDIDPLVERLRRQFDEAQTRQFTSTGRVSKNSPLQLAQQTLQRLDAELVEVRAQMEQVDRDVQELQHLREERIVRGREKAEAEAQTTALTERLKEVELLQKDLERFQGAFETTQQRLNEMHRDRESLVMAETRLADANRELTQRQAEERRAQQEEAEARKALTVLQNRAGHLQSMLDRGRAREARLRDIQELHTLDERRAALRKRQDAVHQHHHALTALRRKKAALPTITKHDVEQLEISAQRLRELTFRAQTVGLRVSLSPQETVTVTADRDGVEETRTLAEGNVTTVTATRNVRLTLPGWGEIDVTSGAEEAAALGAQMTACRAGLEHELKALGLESVASARTCAELARDLERDIAAAEARLSELLERWDSLEALVADGDKTEAETTHRRTRLNVSDAEAALSPAELKVQLAGTRAALSADEDAWRTLHESIAAQAAHIDAIGATREDASKDAHATRNRIASLASQLETIRARYPDGIENAEEHAQAAFVEAKAELDVARRKLPEDWEKLDARHDRALKSATQAARDYQDVERRIGRLETLLDHIGSQGLYSRETGLVEAIANAKGEADRLYAQALAARFLAGLIDYRKKAAVRTVLKPLEDQLSATFAEITGDLSRHVFLDENLQVSGIGRTRDACIAFAQLSQGAREQLLLALRAAVALELARDELQILILDDVLVNTDSTRQENVLDFIQAISQRVQVLIVTCHPERYRGIGKRIRIEHDVA